ncbi:RnfH family protein [Roseateles depolymerans]|uniref:UPF0125 protein RD2015_3360 n=1 Tax=Roseateles depolymerans TaxID=76731 RepID=A0A0U3MTY3_9BURK|nr:RnfH family protein [Roseateles depolymerans]ALV07818.1 Protein RnfH [Roseateles depolymerans]REG21961.1 hypothetical protein DES44_1098 [Roseateles depolymerans]
MGPAETAGSLAVEVLWSPERGQWRRMTLSLPEGSTVVEALRASQWFDEAALRTLKTGIWSKLRPLDTPLRQGDRVEVYRPLTVDPKEARRQRYQATGRRIVTRHRPLGKKA